jgi:hypothetical protein
MRRMCASDLIRIEGNRRRVEVMTKRDGETAGGTRSADAKSVVACVHVLNQTIGELARTHGSAAVVAALTEVMGCSSCVGRRDQRIISALVKLTGPGQ